jgi:hypothetical protein
MTIALDHKPRRSSITPLDRAAQGLGLFSIALGVAEIMFPGTLGRALGLEGKQGLLRAYGVREIAAGIGALQPNPAPAMVVARRRRLAGSRHPRPRPQRR